MRSVGQCLKLAKLVFHIVDKTPGLASSLSRRPCNAEAAKKYENKNRMDGEKRSVIVPKYTVENKKRPTN